MYEHMVNWEFVREDMAGLTPKGIDSAYIHIGMAPETMIVVTGNRNDITLPMLFYPGYEVPVYGF